MIDYFALALTHGLLVIALLRLARRSDLDSEGEFVPSDDFGDDAEAETRREARQRRRNRA
ncbi:hypothetical protein [Qipengyuania sp. MTN3-11]|uniref:hypothetical protein n=1 Tax=Qipengyuania sp. MTN3-11 TaxID=3056557 RepID=UPI0036F1B769